jgi:S-adenosylmethionine:tRNA ribosyltransferase-isomerase
VSDRRPIVGDGQKHGREVAEKGQAPEPGQAPGPAPTVVLPDVSDERPLPDDLRVDDFDYELPAELIAQTPLPQRDRSRLMVVERATGAIRHSSFERLGDWLRPGDLLVANNSRVLAARLQTRKLDTGGRVELLLLRERDDGRWDALAKPARRLRPGTRLVVAAVLDVPPPLTVRAVGEAGEIVVEVPAPVLDRLDRIGAMPLPPYITQRLDDPERYQTVYASAAGSAAAPTAGLHFTAGLIAALRERGIGWAEVTLHVGLDTFRPVTAERVLDHRIHREWCTVAPATATAVAEAKARGGRVVAVGTTAARTLETLGREGAVEAGRGFAGMTDLFIVPGYRWRVVDALLTNFHLPRSTLLMMIGAFAGMGLVREAYAEAIRDRYRFFSFGDAMLIV